jgi:hypothetical protein
MQQVAEVQEFEFAIEPLPPGRLGRRWRWELWSGAMLIGAGWSLSLRGAERGVRTAASRRAHLRLGLRALRPDRTDVVATTDRGRTWHVDCGAVRCVLALRQPLASRNGAYAQRAA